jgi:hypothetical protein
MVCKHGYDTVDLDCSCSLRHAAHRRAGLSPPESLLEGHLAFFAYPIIISLPHRPYNPALIALGRTSPKGCYPVAAMLH